MLKKKKKSYLVIDLHILYSIIFNQFEFEFSVFIFCKDVLNGNIP